MGLADSLIARIVKQRDLIAAMDEHCRSMAARVTSRDENVSVEVDGYGSMTGLWLGLNAPTLGTERLSKLVVETAHPATIVVADRQEFLSAEFNPRIAELRAPLTR
ncbi:hypothetical protein ACGFK1_23380 [Mycobacterium sp. NPDC048908]|uniref:hypothetical protein n=1 Tax=Mycobacterium sp. NPDC048908 TaxID=3364292 RepID=UPI00371426FF